MAENQKVLRRRVRSISGTQQITRAMEMVSAAKLRHAQRVLFESRPYANALQLMLSRLARGADESMHAYFSPREINHTSLVVITADRGLCGAYNSSIIRATEQFLLRQPEGSVELYCIGRRGAEYFRNEGYPIVAAWEDMGGVLDLAHSGDIAERLSTRFLSGETDVIYFLFNAYVSTSQYALHCDQLLPFNPEKLAESDPMELLQRIDYMFEPSQKGLCARLLPAYLGSKVYITLAEAFTAEHSARMLAMNNATKNCDDMFDDLTLKMNKARQGAITGDLIDIVGGAEALKG